MLCELFLVSHLHMYMTSTLPLFTGDSVLTTPSTQETVKPSLSDDDQSGMSDFHVYVSTTTITINYCMNIGGEPELIIIVTIATYAAVLSTVSLYGSAFTNNTQAL